MLGKSRSAVMNVWGHRGLASAASGSRYMLEKVGDVAIVTMDEPGSKVNTISSRMQADFADMLDTIAKDDSVKATVLISAKKDNFIAGADIKELAAMKTVEEATNASQTAQELLGRIAQSSKPFIAAINGSCLGGGLEVALHCQYRIATSNKKTILGLPEVQLGVLPGAGGTQRLPQAVGIQASLDMILTGKNIRPDKARKMGLVHEVVDPSALRTVAIAAAQEIADGKLVPKKKKKGLMGWALEGNPLGRKVLFDQASKIAMKKSGGNYPAIPKILKVLETGASQGLQAGLAAESKAFGELARTKECASLQSIFFGMTDLKKNRFGEPSKPVETVGILGAGLMGAGVAQVSAQRGFKVLLKDVNVQGLGRGEKQITKNLDTQVKRRRMTKYDRDVTASRIVGLTNEDNWENHFKKDDLVIEAVLEDLTLKHRVLQEMEAVIPEHAVFATNTSAIPIRDIAAGASRPENVVGMHYFSPVDKMPLLEVIPHETTSKDTLAKTVSVGLKQGKTVIVVKDVAGFYVNRCLGPFMAEVIALVQDGVPLDQLEKAMLKYGFPVGPITLCDEVGLDVAMHVQETLSGDLGVRMGGGDSTLLNALVDAGLLGRKNGKGFYTYPAKGKKTLNTEVQSIIKPFMRTPVNMGQEEIQQRMAYRFINEALFCLQDEIIANPTDGDIGAVFGVGFPPFRGGPFREVDSIGAEKFVDTMNRFADSYGEHFVPAPIVVDYAKSGKTFH